MTIRSWSMGTAGKVRLGFRAAFMACLLFAAPAVVALGLGEIKLNSSLNEPLDAEIVVLSSEDLEDGQLLVSLASAEAFERAGISREFFLSQMQFSIYRNSADLHIIKIATEQPVVEPYLNFLIQLQWPAGRVMREYTLLLDLPIYAQGQQALEVAPAVTESGVTGSESAPQSALQSAASSNYQPGIAPLREPLSGEQHQVIVGDTLWNVAKRLRPRDTTILQTMDSLYRHNSDAFVEGDANRIKAGSVLRLPSFDEISLEAGDTVAAQIGLKNPSIASDELELALEQAAEAAGDNQFSNQQEQPLISDGRLELASAFDPESDSEIPAEDQQTAAPEAGNSADYQAVGQAGQVSQLSEELAVANDEVNKALQENIELRERLALLEAQVATMAALLNQAENTASQADTEAAAPVQASAAAPASENQSLAQQLAAVPSYFWLVLIAIVLFLVVLLVRKSSREQESKALSDDLTMAAGYEEYDEQSSTQSAANQHELDALDDLELDPDDNLFDESDEDIFDNGEESDNADVFDMMVEAVAEADVYLSLGKTAEAIEVLEEARAQDPADAASRLKLMEVLFRENRKDELRVLFEEIQTTGDEAAIEMAAIIVGPDVESEEVATIAEDTVASELEGLDFQSTDFEDLGLGSVDLSDLKLDDMDLEDVEFEGSEMEDLDLENLTADDFDIEPADEPQVEPQVEPETAEVDLPGVEELAEDAGSDDIMDEFAEFDDVDEQDAVEVKLDLAKTYLEMGDPEGAKEILEELIEESNEEGQAKARSLLETV
ncbi:MAG: FimV/HubP family polar landmark protein [Porticoccaceae bacterium]|nr:FimV/HubP family polar landmark protein [Porticoccaceae bacterium]